MVFGSAGNRRFVGLGGRGGRDTPFKKRGTQPQKICDAHPAQKPCIKNHSVARKLNINLVSPPFPFHSPPLEGLGEGAGGGVIKCAKTASKVKRRAWGTAVAQRTERVFWVPEPFTIC